MLKIKSWRAQFLAIHGLAPRESNALGSTPDMLFKPSLAS